MDIQVFDNFEDDGQLSMFDFGEDIEELQVSMVEETVADKSAEKGLPSSGTAGCRIRKCATCGRMLFVREDGVFYTAYCNACDITYTQKM